ncbi:fluoride efflux transporter CrcB [Methylobacter psychrophilus]|uniref:fluoride efflux transporter CrcB n=1 Tax=Methylobacter psychrophilus TaxID=96941 RepID=UPI0021D4D7A2|nr:fluoride efflux transporter CrcB [Methylobacter psychrophilus]
MNQIIAVALGGASGAVMRFLISSGLYQWLGRGFPYGTLVVNVLGSFLIGLLTEALILQRIPMTLEYRAAILVGFIGAFTTFSTFSLETIYLLEQGSLNKAALNVIVSLLGCLLAVWIGLLCGRTLFLYSGGMIHWSGGVIPFALLIVNAIGAFLIGIVATILLQKVALSMEYRAAIMVIMIGTYLTLSGLYLILFLIEHGYSFEAHTNLMLGTFVGNGLSCLLVIWLGLLVGKQI